MAHPRSVTIILTIILLSATSSCGLPSSSVISTPTQTSASLPPATNTAIPTNPAVPTKTAISTIESTLAATPTLVAASTITPTSAALHLPVGLATVPATASAVKYYDLKGALLGELQAPDFGTGAFQQAHIAGPLTLLPGTVAPPLVFYAFKNGGELWLNDHNSLSLIKATPNLFAMVGIPGKPTFVYTLVEYVVNGIRSLIYIGDSQSLPNAQMTLDTTNAQSYAIKPLAIAEANDRPAGIWYTMVPYGIGGDIVFEPRQSLNYLVLADHNTTTYLDMTAGPAGISDNQTWIAYTSAGGQGPLSIVHNFDFSTTITFPLRADSDRGSGDAVFSPDNHYVAWREAGGSLMDQPATFHETIRVGSVDGHIISEIPDTDLVAASGLSQISWVVPIGWLDPQTLVLQVRGSDWNTASILSIKFDGSQPALLAPGLFIGFLYP